MKFTKKITLSLAVGFLSNFAVAQTLQEGILNIDSHKYAKAKEIFSSMVAKSPSDENYFYLGNTYLSQSEPDLQKAQESFNKGIALDSKSYLNKIGLASIKLYKADKSGIADIQKIVADSKEKDGEVLYRAAEALTMFDKTNSPDLAIDYLNKAIAKDTKNGVPANYYYSLGDAYRLKKIPGDAMSAYDKASAVAKNKASVFTRMATLWMAAGQWKLAKESIDKSISVDPTYAPAYKALNYYDFRFGENAKATQDLINYSKYADEDPYTMLEIAKLYFTNDDFENSKVTLDKIFDKVDDPIKYKLRAYNKYQEGKYAEAKIDLDTFMKTVTDKARIQPADQGLDGLLLAATSREEKDAAKKAMIIADATKKINIAKAAKDETMSWDLELAKAMGGTASQADADAGPTNPMIEGLKKMMVTNPKDTDNLFKLANAYQDAKNWNGAILSWQKMSTLLPDWAPASYSLGYSYQQAGNNEAAKTAYEKYISLVKPADLEANKATLSYAYFAVAYLVKDSDLPKAKNYIAKSIEYNPTYEDAINLNKQLNK